jgi:hypothetical protein
MYIYLSSVDSLHTYPHNNSTDFTCDLSQVLDTKFKSLGLKEISLNPKLSDSQKAEVTSKKNEDSEVFLYVIVSQCYASEAHSFKQPIMRMLSLNEFKGVSTLVRFPDVCYIPIKEHYLASLSVSIRLADSDGSGLDCIPSSLFTGITRCTFHLQNI